jgi:MFS family permease/quinol monooxygenase YgiN
MDRRKLLIFAQLWSLTGALLLGVFTLAGWMSPGILLLFTFTLGVGSALATPPFQAIVPELVPPEVLPGAVALNSMGVNIARAVGPAVGGILISVAGVGWVFVLNAVSFVFVVLVLWRWRRQPRISLIPPEHFFSAMRNGWRYARANPELQTVLVRAASFFLFASALWALLPLVGKRQLEGSANGYAILLSCLGVGAVIAAFTLPQVRRVLSPTVLTVLAAALFAAATAVTAASLGFYASAAAMVVAGWAWLASLSTFNVTAQVVIAEWVKGRGLAMYQIAFFGCQTLGSIAWGQLAETTSVAIALFVASAGLLAGSMTAVRYRLARPDDVKLQPSLHWPEPQVLIDDAPDRGLILTTVEYRVAAEDAASFLGVMRQIEQMRRRNGGFDWGVFEDLEQPGRFIEHFLSESWTEHLRQHQRTTLSDRALQEEARRFHRASEPPRVTHLAAPGTRREDGRAHAHPGGGDPG